MSAEMTVLNENWLNYTPTTSTTLTTTNNLMSDNIGYYHTQPYTFYQSYPWITTYVTGEPARPIKLTMAEVDKLRKAAKADDALKAVLAKFTKQIEVIVDF